MSEFIRCVGFIGVCAGLAAVSFWASVASVIIVPEAPQNRVVTEQYLQVHLGSLSSVGSFRGVANFFQLLRAQSEAGRPGKAPPGRCIYSIEGSPGLWTWVQCECANCRSSAGQQILPSSSAGADVQGTMTCSGVRRWFTLSANASSTGAQSMIVGSPAGRALLARLQLPPTMSLTASSAALFLVNCPVISLLLITMLAIFVCLWRGIWSVDLAVADACSILQRLELWRVPSAALSHHSPIHFAMNAFSLCNLAFIEPLIGSYTFGVVTVCLVVVVEVLDAVWRMALSGIAGYEEQQKRPHLGFSGVLFAWMMFATAQLETFCPIPFLPLCVPTFAAAGFRLNLGPLILVAIIQVLVPISSFIGHCAGVLAGIAILICGTSPLSLSLILSSLLLAMAAVATHAASKHRSHRLEGHFATVGSVAQMREQQEKFTTRLFVLGPVTMAPCSPASASLTFFVWLGVSAWQLWLDFQAESISRTLGTGVFIAISLMVHTDSSASTQDDLGSVEESESLIPSRRPQGRVGALETLTVHVGPWSQLFLQGHAQWLCILWLLLGCVCVFEVYCSAAFCVVVLGQLFGQAAGGALGCNSVVYFTAASTLLQLASVVVCILCLHKALKLSLASGLRFSSFHNGLAELNRLRPNRS